MKSHILYLITFSHNHAVNEIMCKNVVELERLQMTVWRMCTSCYVLTASSTQSRNTQHLLPFCYKMVARNVHCFYFLFASCVSSLLMVVCLRKSTAYSK